MIKVCFADNYPRSTFWRKIYLKEHAEISIVANVGSFDLTSY
jgi:hypothetical protein